MHKCVIFTLFENDYAYGVGSLLNSAFLNNFRGKFIVGYKGSLPFWLNQLEKQVDFYFIDGCKDIEIEFLEIKSDLHLRYYKPFLFEQLLLRFKDHKIFYFDPDITIIGDWKFFEEWVEYGTALVLDDCFPVMPFNHPLKHQWGRIFSFDVEKGDLFNFYVNSGFVGGDKNSIDLIKKWKQNILKLVADNYDLTDFNCAIKKFSTYKRLNPVVGDQDILNASIISNYESIKLSLVGPEGMGFTQAGYLMLHNTGKKSWNNNFLLDFLKNGVKIKQADYSYVQNSIFPINLYPSLIQKFSLKFNIFFTQILQRIF